MTTASMVRMVRRGTPLAEAAGKRRARGGASGPISRSSRSTGVSLMTVVGPGGTTRAAGPYGLEETGSKADGDRSAAASERPPDFSTFSATRSACQVRVAGRVNMREMAAEKADEQPHRRWWHRGPFVHREVRLSVGTLLIFLFVFYVAFPLLANTQLTHAVLPHDGPRRLRLFRINMSTLALSHVSPGGTAPGAALGYRLLTQSGVSGSDTGFALGTQGIGSAVVLNVIFWFALVAFLVAHGFHAPSSHHGGQSQSASILVIVAAGVGVVLLGAFGGLFYLLTRGQERASRVIRRVAGRIRFLEIAKA